MSSVVRRRILTAILLLLLPGISHAKLEIEGISGAAEKNVRAWLSIARLPEDADSVVIRRRYRRARKEITTALQALGYYKPSISSELSLQEKSWLARFQIDPGQRTTVRAIDVEFAGDGAQQRQAAFETPALKGKPLDHSAYDGLKDSLLDDALAAGYLDARLTDSRLLIHPDEAAADFKIAMDTGRLYRFGDIRIEQDILDDEVIGRYIQIRSGEDFDSARLLDLQLRMLDLDYFQSLDLDTTKQTELGTVDVTLKATPKLPQRYQFGAGYGTDTGARFSVNSEFRHLNRKGHRLNNSLRVAEAQQQVTSQYLIPTGSEVGSNWSAQIQYQHERFGDSDSEDIQTGLTRTAIRGDKLWQFYLNYQLENFRVGNERSNTELLLPGVSLTMRTADDSLNPTRGYKLFAGVKGAHEDWASSDSFVQVLLQGRLMYPISAKSRLLLRGELGRSFVGPISSLPLSQRFFAGGDQSVRGYAYKSLAPRDNTGTVIGGRYLSVMSVELDRIFWRDYGAAVFFDYGGATDDLLQDLSRGVGLGLRWRTGIGMVRADFARPLDRPEDGFRFHIGIGAQL